MPGREPRADDVGMVQSLRRIALLLCLVVLVIPALHEPARSAEQNNSTAADGSIRRPILKDLFTGISEENQRGGEEKLEDVAGLVERLSEADTGSTNTPAKSPDMVETPRQAIERILKRTISRRPDDVHVLDPVFAAATEGTPDRRRAAIEILGSLKEPLAEPLLAGIAADKGNPLRETALTGLNRIRSQAEVSRKSTHMMYLQVVLLAVSIVLACGLVAIAVQERRTRQDPWRVVLLLLCVLMVVWFLGIVGADYLMSTVTDTRIDRAVERKQAVALAKKINFEWSEYPGDSYAARYLVLKGNPAVIPLLAHIKNETLPSIRYQDYWNKHLERRIDWTIARLEERRKRSEESVGGPADRTRQ
ncbi:MAG: hypothetical protein RDU20_06685 [Desulfomonilaceae bacterium]|nr:hypothetical protein [Desulfomonilaceae bacterium]